MRSIVRFIKELRREDYLAIISALVGVNIIDILGFWKLDIAIPPIWKIVIVVILIVSVLLFVGARRDFKAIHSFQEQSKEEAEFFGKWYSKKGKLIIFCTDFDWLDDKEYEVVVRALKAKSKENHLKIYLKEYDNQIVEDLVRRGAKLFRVRKDIISEHRFSININEHVYSMILRNKKNEPMNITVEEYIDHRALANLGIDMLDDSYERESVPHQTPPYTAYQA